MLAGLCFTYQAKVVALPEGEPGCKLSGPCSMNELVAAQRELRIERVFCAWISSLVAFSDRTTLPWKPYGLKRSKIQTTIPTIIDEPMIAIQSAFSKGFRKPQVSTLSSMSVFFITILKPWLKYGCVKSTAFSRSGLMVNVETANVAF